MKAIFKGTILCVFLLVSSTLHAKKIEITLWHSLGFHVKEIVETLVKEYNRSHPNVVVNSVYQGGFEEMHVKMLAAAVTRTLPDIAEVPVEFMQPYIINGIAEPLNDEIPDEIKNDIVEKMWSLVERNGKIYGIPFCISTEVFFYNEDIFMRAGFDPEKPPSTWEELVEMGKKLTKDTDGDGIVDRYAVMFWTHGMYGLAPLLWAKGGHLFSEDGRRVILTSREMKETIELIYDLVFTHKIMPQKWTDWEGGQAFLTGKIAMGWFTSPAIAFGEKNLPWKLKIAPIPSIDGKRYTILGGASLMNFSHNKKKRKAANDFMMWLVNKENTTMLHERTGFIPVRESALNSLELRAFWRENPNFVTPVDELSTARIIPFHADFYKINKEIQQMIQRIILEKADPVAELARTEQRINEMINQ